MSVPVPVFVATGDQPPGKRLLDNSTTYCLPLTVGQWMAAVAPVWNRSHCVDARKSFRIRRIGAGDVFLPVIDCHRRKASALEADSEL